MLYLKGLIGGLLAGLIALIVLITIAAYKYRAQGAVGINVAAPLTMIVLATAFAVGFYVVVRFSK